MDSIIARPTNKVRVIVVAESGCFAGELNALATARPSPSAGPILPRAIVRPAVMIEAIAMSVMLFIVCPFVVGVVVSVLGLKPWLRLARTRGGRDIHRGQDAKNISLH